MALLLAPDFWHNFRMVFGGPVSTRLEFLFDGNESEAKNLVNNANAFFEDRPALGLNCYTGSSSDRWEMAY